MMRPLRGPAPCGGSVESMPPPTTHAGSPGHQVKEPGPAPGASVAEAAGPSWVNPPLSPLTICTSEPGESIEWVNGSAAKKRPPKRCRGMRSVAGALPVAVTPPAPGTGPFGKEETGVAIVAEAGQAETAKRSGR